MTFQRLMDAFAWLVIAFILGPLAIIIGGSFTTKPYVEFPPTGLTLRWYAQLMHRHDFLDSFVISIVIALACTAVALALGVLAAVGLHRHSFLARPAFQSFFMSPLVLPTVVTGVALLQFYYIANINAPLTGLIIGHIVITTPYVIRTVGAGLINLDPAIEEAAVSLGATNLRSMLRVTLPAIAPSIMAAAIFVFITSFDQVTVSIFLTGPDTMPLPIRIYTYIDFAVDPMVAAVSALLIIFSFALIAVLQWLLGLDRAFGVTK